MDELQAIFSLPEGPGRTAALAAWVQSLYDTDREKPILEELVEWARNIPGE